MIQQIHIIVKGKVQGVSFRYYTEAKAQSLGLNGWVRNLKDGTVEIQAQGSHEKLSQLESWCWEGSPHSKVDQVIIEHISENRDLPFFRIQY